MRRNVTVSADRGSATVWAALTAVVLCGVLAVVLGLGQAVAARHRAGGAADLAALAAADHALEGEARACDGARRVAAAQRTWLARCAVRGEVADVTVGARWGPYAPEIRARAGPPSPTPSRTTSSGSEALSGPGPPRPLAPASLAPASAPGPAPG